MLKHSYEVLDHTEITVLKIVVITVSIQFENVPKTNLYRPCLKQKQHNNMRYPISLVLVVVVVGILLVTSIHGACQSCLVMYPRHHHHDKSKSLWRLWGQHQQQVVVSRFSQLPITSRAATLSQLVVHNLWHCTTRSKPIVVVAAATAVVSCCCVPFVVHHHKKQSFMSAAYYSTKEDNDNNESEPKSSDTPTTTTPPITPISSSMISALGFYKAFISPLLPPACRFVPTCSQYGVQAIQEFGPTKGSVLIAWRLLRCSPIGGKGYDPPQWPPVSYTHGSW